MQMFQRSLSSRPLATHSWMASSITHSTKNPTGVKEVLGIQTQQAIASISIIILTLITHRERLGRGNSQGTKCKIGAREHIEDELLCIMRDARDNDKDGWEKHVRR